MSDPRANEGLGDVQDPRLVGALEEYLAEVEAGRPPSRDEFLARHQAVAGLAACLDGMALLGDGKPESPIDLRQPLGDYRLLREVGRGGMGVVYEAVQLSLGRRVAVKVLPFAATMDPKRLQRFQNEARAAASLEHPHIVPVYGVGCERGVHYYAMKYIDGISLAEHLARRSGVQAQQPANEAIDTRQDTGARTDPARSDTPSHRLVAQWAVQAAEALEHAHSLGIIHRDVKPANLLLGGQGQLWVADFGLARTVNSDLTVTGDVVGTLRYMSPEQALAKHGLVDHRTDVYSLGATLYEVLTGRPAVTGDDRAEILRKIAFEEPVALRMIDRSIQADLETVVLKALAKDPTERYATAGELADDLRRFLEDQPIQARRPTLWQRLARSARRRPRATSALVLGTALLLVGGWWWDRQRTQTEGAARQVADQAEDLFRRRRFSEAESVARWAADLLPRFGGDTGLQRRVSEMVADLALLRRLGEARLERVNFHLETPGDFLDESTFRFEIDSTPVSARLAATFWEEYGLDVLGGDEPTVLAELGRRAIRSELVAALDDWSCDVKDPRECRRLQRLADALDADKDGIASRWRQLSGAGEADELRRLAAEAEANPPPPAFLVRLAFRVAEFDKAAAVRLARLARQREPDDQWINGALAQTLLLMGPDHAAEALRFWTAAQALRPDSTLILSNLGVALNSLGRHEEALEPLRLAKAIRPDSTMVRNNLGIALCKLRRYEESAEELRRAVELRPDNSGAWYNLGRNFQAWNRHADAAQAYRKANDLRANVNACAALSACLSELKRFPEAEAAGREAVRLDPASAEAHFRLGIALSAENRRGEAIDSFRKSIELKPGIAVTHYNLGIALALLRRYEDAEAALRQAIRLKPDYAMAHRNLGNTLRQKGDPTGAVEALREAIRHEPGNASSHVDLGMALSVNKDSDGALRAFRKAIDVQPNYPWAHYNLGNVLRDQKNRDGAVTAYREAIRLRPDLAEAYCNLGHVLREQGRFAEALAELRRGHELGSRRADWSYPSAKWVETGERLATRDERLSLVLQGKSQPKDAEERLGFAQLCLNFRNCYAVAASFYAEAFAELPALAASPQTGRRYNAACAAALAGCGRGEDATKLSAADRHRWRRQALTWLDAELRGWCQLLEKARPEVAKTMRRWLADADFAGVRDEPALSKLPSEEQRAWAQLWLEVEALRLRAEAPAKQPTKAP